MSQMPDFGQFDSKRLDEFLREFKKLTRHISLEQRSQELDERIRTAELSLGDKIEAFKRRAPSADVTDRREALRMERLLVSIALKDLHLFKFALEYDGDYKDLVEYVFHYIDDHACQARIIGHLGTTPPPIGVKILSDVDDTMYANLIDVRYPKNTLYPGVLEFYDAVTREPFELSTTPVTILSARPNPHGRHMGGEQPAGPGGIHQGSIGPQCLVRSTGQWSPWYGSDRSAGQSRSPV